jgi:Fe-S oxidoreductase
LLTQAGYDPRPLADVCCGLTWITTGQLDAAARRLRRALDHLAPLIDAGLPIIGLEPSCLAVWRSDAARLIGGDPRLPRVAAGLHTLAEFLTTALGWTPPDLTGLTVIVQPHCHHQAVLGWAADAALLARTGAAVVTVSGCCGLAGSFGVAQGHAEVSAAVAADRLLPALAAHSDAIVLADGFSCRTQIADLTGRRAVTLADLLAAGSGRLPASRRRERF